MLNGIHTALECDGQISERTDKMP